MKLTRSATYVMGGRVGMDETHQVNISIEIACPPPPPLHAINKTEMQGALMLKIIMLVHIMITRIMMVQTLSKKLNH